MIDDVINTKVLDLSAQELEDGNVAAIGDSTTNQSDLWSHQYT